MSDIIKEFNSIIYAIENRCMAADGPVTPTLREATEKELSRLWVLIQSIRDITEASDDLTKSLENIRGIDVWINDVAMRRSFKKNFYGSLDSYYKVVKDSNFK